MGLMTLVTFYGGTFVNTPKLSYNGGHKLVEDDRDPDLLSIIDIIRYVEEQGYKNVKALHYKYGGEEMEHGLRKLTCENDLSNMIKDLPTNRIAEVYAEQSIGTCEALIGECTLALPSLQTVENSVIEEQVSGNGPPNGDETEANEGVEEPIVDEIEPNECMQELVVDEIGDRDVQEPVVDNIEDNGVKDETEEEDEGDSSLQLSDFEESDEADDGNLFQDNVDKNIQEDLNNTDVNNIGRVETETLDTPVSVVGTGNIAVKSEASLGDSNELKNLNGSDAEAPVDSCLIFNSKTNVSRPIKFQKGLKFTDVKVFREALRRFAIDNGFDYKYLHNDKWRVTAVCKMNCGWRIHASPSNDRNAFQVKSYKGDQHSCGKQFKNRKVTSTWLAKSYLEYIRKCPNWELPAFKEQVNKDYHVDVSLGQCYRAKKKAIEILTGEISDQYKMLGDYCDTVVSRTDVNNRGRVETEALNTPVSDLGKRNIDVKSEPNLGNSDELRNLNRSDEEAPVDGCPIFNSKNDVKRPIKFQKGLKFTDVNVFREALRKFAIDNGFDYEYLHNDKWRVTAVCKMKCGWRIHASPSNDRSAFQVKSYKGDQHSCGKQLRNRKVTSTWLAKSYLEHIRSQPNWELLAFKEQVHKDYHVDVSVGQCYRAKEKAIEILGGKISDQCKMLGDYCDSILERNPGNACEDKSYNCSEVDHCLERNKVANLSEGPCCHAVAAIHCENKKSTEDHVDACYSKSSFVAKYEPAVNPMPGVEPATNLDPVVPPRLIRQPGRPGKKRIREVEEPKDPNRMRKGGIQMKCGICGEAGHNTRTCSRSQPMDGKRAERLKRSAEAAKARRAKAKAGEAAGEGI